MPDRNGDQIRQKSKDNPRFAGKTVTDSGLQGEESNPRMNGGGASSGTTDDSVPLSGFGPDIRRTDALWKDADLPDGAEDDVDVIAQDLLQLDDPETARTIARIIVRTGDVVGDLAASLEDAETRMNDRMGTDD